MNVHFAEGRWGDDEEGRGPGPNRTPDPAAEAGWGGAGRGAADHDGGAGRSGGSWAGGTANRTGEAALNGPKAWQSCGGPQRSSKPDSTGKPEGEFWHVLVSGQQIVEIRFISPPQATQEGWNECGKAPLVQQSVFASAKDYPTLNNWRFSNGKYRGIRMLQWGMGLLAAGMLMAWLLLR